MPSLNCITEPTLRKLAGDRWFARGKTYQQQDRVADLTTHHDSLSAIVVGTETYRVRLSCRNDRISYSCTCPVGDDGNFCKHCVAVGLAWLSEPAEKEASASSLQTFLENMDHKKLVELILSEASSNRRLRDKLEFEEARAVPAGLDLSVFKKAITNATRTAGIDYYSMPRFARRLIEVIDSLYRLLEDGHAGAVVELTEYFFARLERAVGEVDDSDGHFGEILPELGELHHSACVLVGEDPVGLARRLFKFELETEWDFFHGASAIYADILGNEGLKEYRRLAEQVWSNVPALKPGDDTNVHFGSRFGIISMMETLARQQGDVEALIAVKQRDLSYPYSFLQIAEIYREAKQFDAALEWAEKGAYAFPRLDSRLSDFMANEYHRRGRHDEAMKLIWDQFVESPGLEMYKHLHEHALQVKSPREKLRLVGSETTDSPSSAMTGHRFGPASAPAPAELQNPEWIRWREQALQHLREKLGAPVVKSSLQAARTTQMKDAAESSDERILISDRWASQGDRSTLVEIFLWEQSYEEAWREAVAGGCGAHLWLRLADAIAKEHPDRSYRVYKELMAPTLAPTNNTAYAEAIDLLKKMRKLSNRLNCASEFEDYLVALRVEYKRKRNFIRMLDKLRH